jgi:erythromycin esterase-like protein
MKATRTETEKVRAILNSAYEMKEDGAFEDLLIAFVGDASIVMLGEGTHGTHDFYHERAQITKYLIEKKGFNAIAIEGDWPDAARIHRYVQGSSKDVEAIDALKGFTRFPSWMWANADMLNFVGWLRSFNESQVRTMPPVGFFGLDLYSLFASTREVVAYLEKIDHADAEQARRRFACLDQFGGSSQKYAYAMGLNLTHSCESGVIEQLMDLLKNASKYRIHDGGMDGTEEYFNAEQNCRLIASAEHYYRTMLRDDVSSWNLRDEHMAESLQQIRLHLEHKGMQPKVVVWAHNSHIGDARATEMSQRREFNLGQLVKEAYGKEALSIGFTTYDGTVTAASAWDGEAERKHVNPALSGSYEALFHKTDMPKFFLDLKPGSEVARALTEPLLERAIGVLYLPDRERVSHYFSASLSSQFDAVIHVDHSRAVEPIEHTIKWTPNIEAPDGYPTGL